MTVIVLILLLYTLVSLSYARRCSIMSWDDFKPWQKVLLVPWLLIDIVRVLWKDWRAERTTRGVDA